MSSEENLSQEEVEELVEEKIEGRSFLDFRKINIALISILVLVFLVVPVAADIQIKHDGNLVLGSGVDLNLSDGGGIDVGGDRVKNISSPVNSSDAVNKEWIKDNFVGAN